jgi:hypothetical protein
MGIPRKVLWNASGKSALHSGMCLAYYAPLSQKEIPFETCQGWQSPELPFLDEVALLPEVHSADRAATRGKATQRRRRLPYRPLPLSSAYDNNINQ